MSILAELKRRKVFRVAIAYLVASYGVMQVAELLIRALGIPDWTTRLIFVLIIVGFVPTLIAAWALELTPDGLRFDTGPTPRETSVAGTGRKLDFLIIGMLLLIVAGLIVERFFFAEIGEPPPVATVQPEVERSVAVLSFADLSQDQDQEWFGDGLAEEVLNALARTPDIMVASRTSSFAYKNSSEDISTIARELGVAHVLEGSVRTTGDTLRITAQLIRASDGFHVWSQTYDAPKDDVIEIQEDVAVRIATALETAMDPEALADMMRVGTRSARAYQAYIRAVALRARALRTGELEDYLESYELVEEARRIDPKFASAHHAAADFWKVLLNPTRLPDYDPDLTAQEILDNFLERIDLAIDTANDPIDQALSRAQKAAIQLRLRTAIRRFQTYLEARSHDYRAWHELLIVSQLASDQESAEVALAALKTGGAHDRFAATTYLSTAYRFGNASAAADYGLETLKRWPNDSGLAYQTHRSLLWASRVKEAADLISRMDRGVASNPMVRIRQACAEGHRDQVLKQLEGSQLDDRRWLAANWTVLTLLGEDEKAVELLRASESGAVPYQLASWLVFHNFDPGPFPSLVKMLERENVRRPPAAAIPFACPPA